MAGMDKVTRVLTMYAKLAEGGKVYKNSFCTDAKIGKRTFDRDIEDIRIFLSESFQGNQLVYSKEDECYRLSGFYQHKALSGMEVVALLELLKSSQSLRKDEYVELVNNVYEASEVCRRGLLKEIADRYKRARREEKKETVSLKMQWDLQQSIAERDVIKMHLSEGEQIEVSPVALWNDWHETYLFAYDRERELEEFPITGIMSFQVKGTKFDRCLIEKFDSLTWQEIQIRLEKARMRNKHEKD